ncbi:helix-turn-helix transcriptional regulator [Nocardia iowensis]|uniref:Helix-turn-helix transcriptional regulator n=1 Tax=Nocardia iowensis TaxID=204891 RepID=A0ABX8RP02_NOCIO|nr:helix-turn-helix transcriptional regulator [Nocardia iowensis]QXN90035.1 helix-turn-helix transcriptional regulator [Nocardia iowensis]
MRFEMRDPGPALARFIAYFWALHDVPVHAAGRLVPSGTLDLVVNLHADVVRINDPHSGVCHRYSGTVAAGAYGRYITFDNPAHTSIVGVHFKPGGALPFLGVPPGELADRHVDLELLWGRRPATELRERLCAATTSMERFTVLESTLRSRLPAHVPGHPVLPFALEQLARPGSTVGAVAASVELSRRRFIQVFTREVGMTPKQLSRVLRFQRASELARRAEAPDWGQLALACGYFDQSHLINEVREFTGTTPVGLIRATEQFEDLHLLGSVGSHFSKTAAGARQ